MTILVASYLILILYRKLYTVRLQVHLNLYLYQHIILSKHLKTWPRLLGFRHWIERVFLKENSIIPVIHIQVTTSAICLQNYKLTVEMIIPWDSCQNMITFNWHVFVSCKLPKYEQTAIYRQLQFAHLQHPHHFKIMIIAYIVF